MRVVLGVLVAGAMLAGANQWAAASSKPTLDDAAIVGIFDAANGWDIATGTLAASKASRADVREFASMLVNAHTMVQKQGRDLAVRLRVEPTAVPADFALRKSHEETMKKLQELSGPTFDRAFLEHEIAYHQAVIDAVKGTLLPAIKNQELKDLVVQVAPAFEAHRAGAANLLAKSK